MKGDSAVSSHVRGIDHIGITVPDMEAATRFLREAFDAAIVYDTVIGGHLADRRRISPQRSR
jgi:catechol 2,3-dioxygenase-like lactoylglutathione lyase family enzyme